MKPEAATLQIDQERPKPDASPAPPPRPGDPPPPTPAEAAPAPVVLRRYHASATLGATRVGRDAGQIADEVISHLAGLVGADVTVRLEIEARLPEGAPDHVVRTVLENGRTLKFTAQGFEKE